MTTERRNTASSARRPVTATGGRRIHRSLAPPHIGEALGAALLGVSIVGIAMTIVAISVIFGGLTQAGRLDSPPPNASEIGRLQVVGGLVLLALAAAELALVIGIVLEWRWARPLAAGLSSVLAFISVLAALRALRSGPDPDVVIALALFAAAAVFMVAAGVLITQLRWRNLPED